MRLGVASPYLTPLNALSHPSSWNAGTPTLAPTMAPPKPPSAFAGQKPEQLPMLDAPQAPHLPSAWVAALMGGLTGAADAANGSNYTGGLMKVWGDAKQRYADAQSAVEQENALRARQNMTATNSWTEKTLDYQDDLSKTGYNDTLTRDRTAWEYGEGGPRRPYEEFQSSLRSMEAEANDARDFGHAKELAGMKLRDEKILADYKHNLGPDTGRETPLDKALKQANMLYDTNNGMDAYRESQLEKMLNLPYYAANPNLEEVVAATKELAVLKQKRENSVRAHLQGASAPAPTAPSRVRNLLDRLGKANIHDD